MVAELINPLVSMGLNRNGMKTTQEFASLLGKAYATLGIRQKELAARLGISPGYLSDMKNGNRQVSDEVFGKIADMVGEATIRERREAESGIEELLRAGANAFTKELLRMMAAKQIAPYSLLVEKDNEIARLNQTIGQLKQEIEQLKNGGNDGK